MRRKHQIATQYTCPLLSEYGVERGFCKGKVSDRAMKFGLKMHNKAKLKLY